MADNPDDLGREMTVLKDQINAGGYVDPNEIADLCQRLVEAGCLSWANIMGEHLPDWTG
jgi:hypothetical protein